MQRPTSSALLPPTQYTKQRAQIHPYDGEDVYEFLSFSGQDHMLDHLVDIKGAEEPVPGTKGRGTTVSELTVRPERSEAGIKVSNDSHSNEQLAGTTKQGSTRMLACCIRKRRRGIHHVRLQYLIVSSHLQGLVHPHQYSWMLEIMIQMARLQFKWKYLVLKCLFLYCTFFVNFSYVRTYFFLVETHWNHPSKFNSAFTRISISTNVVGLGTTFNITSVFSD